MHIKLMGKPEGSRHLGNLGINVRMVKVGYGLDSFGSEQIPVIGFYEHASHW
jgi:hypothetical protein